MDAVLEIVIILALSGVLSIAAYFFKMLTKYGAIASFAIGVVVGLFGGLTWFLLLMIFTATGFAATKMGFSKKKEKGLQEGSHGERTHMNILGVGIAPCVLAILSYFAGDEYELLMSIGFIASISVAAADTLGSELGVRDANAWLCTTFKKVPPGTDGGMSLFGTLVSFTGAAVTSILGWLVLFQTIDVLVLIPIAAGFFGSYIDSVFGATIESRGFISKYTNNALTALIGAAFAMLVAWPFV